MGDERWTAIDPLQRAVLRRAVSIEACCAITWKEDYNHYSPRSALGNITPVEFAMKSALEK